MSWQEDVWGWMNAGAALVQAGVVLGTAIVGFRRLDQWRHQKRAEQNAELAEALDLGIVQLERAVRRVRNPHGSEGEGSTRLRRAGESEEDSRRLDSAYVHSERIIREAEIYKHFDDLEAKANVRFNRAVAAELDELRQHVLQLTRAANWMNFEAARRVQLWGTIDEELAARRARENQEILWDSSSLSEPDEYQKKLTEITGRIRTKLGQFRL